MKRLIKTILLFIDFFLVSLLYPSAWFLKIIRRIGLHRLPLCKKGLLNVGVYPLIDQYYEPQFDMRELDSTVFSEIRTLPGINWNIKEQLDILEKFVFSGELVDIPIQKTDDFQFYMNNRFFQSGDAEYWYQLIRLKKPRKIFEVGSGNSTLMAIKAINKNMEEDSSYKCKHVCIEPYEMPWLEKTNVTVVRKKVEDVDISFFSELGDDDILFIDSSHIIRPRGDVLFEYLELLPTLNKGVIVHVHDIFSPRNYRSDWLINEKKFWNEQYLLEAFISNNVAWKITGALNLLQHNHHEMLKKVCPFLTPQEEPGSFYMKKIS